MSDVGRPPHVPTDENRARIKELAACGVPQERIARRFRMDINTLMKYYGDDFHDGKTDAGANIGKTLYEKASNGDVPSMIFYLKTQMGWTDKTQDLADAAQALTEQLAKFRTKTDDV